MGLTLTIGELKTMWRIAKAGGLSDWETNLYLKGLTLGALYFDAAYPSLESYLREKERRLSYECKG